MGSWAGLMIRCGDDASLARVRARFTTARHGDKWPFAVVSIDGTQRKHPADVAALSAELDAEVILLVFTSVTDSIQYTRSVRGRVALPNVAGSRPSRITANIGRLRLM